MNRIFEARNLSRSYGGVCALWLPEFQVERGECVALTGRNGSGKSTLLRLLAFLEEPDTGTLHYYGSTTDPRRDITLLLQDPYLLKCSVFKNVTLGLRLRGETDHLEERYRAAMQDAGFEDPMALASRLALSPRVLLLDEPTAHVDAASEEIIYASVRACLNRGVTVLCATHDRTLFDFLDAREVVLRPRS